MGEIPKPNMNYSNMIEEKALKKTFIIATLMSTIIGTLTASMSLHDKVQEKRTKKEQKQTDSKQDNDIRELKEKLDNIEGHTKELRDNDERSRRSRSSSQVSSRRQSRRPRRRDDYYDEDDAYTEYNAGRSRAAMELAYMDELARLTSEHAKGDSATDNMLQDHLVQLQQTLQDVLHNNRSLTRHDIDHLVAAQNAAQRILTERQPHAEPRPAVMPTSPQPQSQQHQQQQQQQYPKDADPVGKSHSEFKSMNDNEAYHEHPTPPRGASQHRKQSEYGPAPEVRRSENDPAREARPHFAKTAIPGGTARSERQPPLQDKQEGKEGKAQSTKTILSGKTAKPESKPPLPSAPEGMPQSTKTVVSGKTAKPEAKTPVADGKDVPSLPKREDKLPTQEKKPTSVRQEEALRGPAATNTDPFTKPQRPPKNEVPPGFPPPPLSPPPRNTTPHGRHAPNPARGSSDPLKEPQRHARNRSPGWPAKNQGPSLRRDQHADHVEVAYLSRRRSAPGTKLPPRQPRNSKYTPPMPVPIVESPTSPRFPQRKEQQTPAPQTKALPAPPARNLYCRYSQDLQANNILPLHKAFRTEGDHRCPKCKVLVPCDTRDVWVLSTYDPSSKRTVDYRMDARFVVKSHTPEGDFACLLCAKNRKIDRILGDWEKLVEHLGTEHGPHEFEQDVDFVKMKAGSGVGDLKVKSGGKEMLLTR